MVGSDRVNYLELPKYPPCVTYCTAFPFPPHYKTPRTVLKSS